MKKYLLSSCFLVLFLMNMTQVLYALESTPKKMDAISQTQDRSDLRAYNFPDYSTLTQEPTTSSDYSSSSSEISSSINDDKGVLPGGYFKMTGSYRLAAGVDDDFIVNDSFADLSEKNFRYLFGEKLNNTFDPSIYSRHEVNIDFAPKDNLKFYTQIVNDPWSVVGTTGEQVQRSDIGGETLRYNLKYFGSNNRTIGENYRSDVADSISFPAIKVKDGHTTPTTVHGFTDFNPATGGIPFTIPELDIDYEYRPIRKLWMDYEQEEWKLRLFALADEKQALSTDDPLNLSNHRDYWQQSPWLYQYKPLQHFSDGSIKRGYYDDSLSYIARDSSGNRLVLLRGASLQAGTGDTTFEGTVAAPYTPWDENYYDADNIPGAFRLKHQVNENLLLGTTYTFRSGLVDQSIADYSQAGGVDAKYNFDENTSLVGEVAMSGRSRDLLSNPTLEKSDQGFAYKTEWKKKIEHENVDRVSDVALSYAQMDKEFDAVLSRYTNTRDDRFWGNHLSFNELSPDLEYFRLGDGLDRNRMVFRAQWREKMFAEKFQNLFDVRNVHKASNTAYLETALRDEVTYKINEQWAVKGLFRWHGFPETTAGFDPYLASYYFVGYEDPASLRVQNSAVQADQDADRFTYAAALQYVINDQWTAEGFYERTNDIPDFPRGLLNGAFRDANDRIDGILTDRVTTFLYGQSALKALPPYDYFNIFRERLVYKPQDNLKFTFHAAQNGYKFAGGIDDNINHQGISAEFDYNERLKFFFDYTHSKVIDVPHLIASNYTQSQYLDHHNVYASMDYKINSSTVFRSEYGVFGLGSNSPQVTPYSTTGFSLPTLDTEHLLRVSLNGDF